MEPSLLHKLLIVLTIITILHQLPDHTNASPSPPITALYVFGDSTVDPGNNNYIPTLFRSDHYPYGKSFPTKLPTGRFSDGKLATDFVASSLKLKPTLPPYLSPSVKPVDLLTGVSFASAGSGYDNRTAMLSFTLTMDQQSSYFEESVRKMKSLVGDSETKRVIKNALFLTSAGTNDMTNNVYGQESGSSVSVSKYQDLLLTKVEAFVQKLYKAGARRIAIVGLPPIGCLPVQVTIATFNNPLHNRTCIENQNADSQLYNQKLNKLIFRLNRIHRGSKFIYLDIYSPLMDMVIHPSKYGLLETLKGCCGTGFLEQGPLCQAMSGTCEDVSKYLFFDSVHPSQKAYSVIAKANLGKIVFSILN